MRDHEDCMGTPDSKCTFYKTPEQFIQERNRAIEINRRKGNCESCKYNNGVPCTKFGGD